MTDVTPAERELLTYLVQECVEIAKEATKAMLYGWDPVDPHTSVVYDNRAALEIELGDFVAVTDKMIGAGMVQKEPIAKAAMAKHDRMALYTRYQPDSHFKGIAGAFYDREA